MSLHSSLKIDRASVTQRSVQTRIERIKELMKKGLWKEETGVIGLPKTKIIRIKAKKKVKAEEVMLPLPPLPVPQASRQKPRKPLQNCCQTGRRRAKKLMYE